MYANVSHESLALAQMRVDLQESTRYALRLSTVTLRNVWEGIGHWHWH